MNASKLTSRKNRREERKKGKGSTTGQALTIISACLSSISLRSFSLPWWGLTPPRGQAPVDVVHVHVLTLKHAPGIPQRRRERHVRHAKAGTPRAILDHTYSGTIAAVRVNGTEIGETGINAYLAGHHGVPVVLVTGDRAVTAEAKALIPNIHTVAVKDATGATSARNLHPKKAREQIRAEATKAIQGAKSILPIRAKTPIEMIVEFRGTYAADRAAMIPTVRRVGGLRV